MKIINEDYKSTSSVALMEKINKLRKPASLCMSAGAACAVGGPSMFELFGLGKYQFIPIIAAVIVFALACHRYYQIFLIKKELAARPVTQEEKDTAKERNKKSNIKYILILLALLLLCIFFSTVDFGGSGSGNASSECKSCHRTFYAGDSEGNYRNIARTGMCNNCYDNYKWAQDYLGK